MKWTLIALSLTATLLSCLDAKAVVNIYGPGGMTCAKYSQSTDSDKDDFKYWGLGYVSGINSMKNLDIVRGKDQASMFQWIDNYCKNNPQSTYNGAVDSLIIEINKLQVP